MKRDRFATLKYPALLLLCGGIFAVTFRLFHLPVAAALYPSALCTLVLLCVFGWEHWQRRRKLEKLTALAALPDDLPERLGEFTGVEDAAYREIILGLIRRAEETQRETQRRVEER